QYVDTLVEAYQKIADVFLKKGSYKEALRILAEGIEKTQNAALSEHADYLNEHIIMTKWTCSKDRKLIAEASFDPSGNLTKIITYKDGNIASQNEYTYDTAGKFYESIC
ncbi:MAG: hypothetical protein K2H91_12225, partial [Lachnospiraceae bacterium]|nr:hypothetical protein [Lachnospiraceae bacterium]